MKKILFYISMITVFGLLSVSCRNMLDSDFLFNDRMSVEDVFTDKDYTERWLARAYSFLGNGYLQDVASKSNVPFNFADDMYFSDRGTYYKMLKNGEYFEYNVTSLAHDGQTYTFDTVEMLWRRAFEGIRHASIFLQNIDMNTEFTPEVVADMKAQARFIRAYCYWALLRVYGPVPLLPDEGLDYMLSYEELAKPRNTYEECADFITNELVMAAKDLPLGPRDMNNTQRITRGAALGLRAKILLYAASPMMNGQGNNADVKAYAAEMTDNKGNPLLSLTYDEEKWAKAAAAAKDVIDLGIYGLFTVQYREFSYNVAYPVTIDPPYHPEFSEQDWPNGWRNIDPYESYRAFFNGTEGAFQNPELIFTRGRNITQTDGQRHGDEGIRAMVNHQSPASLLGWNCHGLTQKQVDAYYMIDGTDVPGKDKEIGRGNGSERPSGYVTVEDEEEGRYLPLRRDVSLQYANREPRFYASVGFNGAFWNALSLPDANGGDRNRQWWYYRTDPNGMNPGLFLYTGIGMTKYVHPRDASMRRGEVVDKYDPAIRYAEILLIYAEALNELTASHTVPAWDEAGSHTVQRNVEEMRKGIRPIRIRAGLPDYTSNEYENPDVFRAKLKRERQIELMAEGHRYFDLRRWMDAQVEESLPIYGCNMYATPAQRDLFHTPIPVPQLPTTFSRKMWFFPIAHLELSRNKALTQNPGWTYPVY